MKLTPAQRKALVEDIDGEGSRMIECKVEGLDLSIGSVLPMMAVMTLRPLGAERWYLIRLVVAEQLALKTLIGDTVTLAANGELSRARRPTSNKVAEANKAIVDLRAALAPHETGIWERPEFTLIPKPGLAEEVARGSGFKVGDVIRDRETGIAGTVTTVCDWAAAPWYSVRGDEGHDAMIPFRLAESADDSGLDAARTVHPGVSVADEVCESVAERRWGGSPVRVRFETGDRVRAKGGTQVGTVKRVTVHGEAGEHPSVHVEWPSGASGSYDPERLLVVEPDAAPVAVGDRVRSRASGKEGTVTKVYPDSLLAKMDGTVGEFYLERDGFDIVERAPDEVPEPSEFLIGDKVIAPQYRGDEIGAVTGLAVRGYLHVQWSGGKGQTTRMHAKDLRLLPVLQGGVAIGDRVREANDTKARTVLRIEPFDPSEGDGPAGVTVEGDSGEFFIPFDQVRLID